MSRPSIEERVAALERQVAQHDEGTAQQLKWRSENLEMRDDDVRRRNLQRDEELAEAREVNGKLVSQINQLIVLHAQNDARLRQLEVALAVGAVDPVAGISSK